jgi:hypothetical protein
MRYSELEIDGMFLVAQSNRHDRVDLLLNFVVGDRSIVVFVCQQQRCRPLGDCSHNKYYSPSYPHPKRMTGKVNLLWIGIAGDNN